jgi:hypothetical protein
MNNLEIPTKLKEKYLKTYIEIGNELLLNKRNYAALISGSIIERPDKNSDLDIVVITNQKYWQRKQLSINGVFVEIFFYSENDLKKSFKEKDYQDMHMVAYGYVMFDKTNCLRKLKKIAIEKFEKGPGLMNKEDVLYSKYLIWDQNQDIEDIIDKDEASALALMNKSIWNSLELFYALKNKWFCKPKNIMSSVKEIDNDLYVLLNKFYSLKNNKVKSKYLIYRNIVSTIIEPYDLDRPFEWIGKKHKSKF